MIGIIFDDFELLLKKNKSILSELTDNIADLKNISNILNSKFYSSDLKFLMSKLDSQLTQLDIVEKKINAYYNTLNSVYNSYNEQAIQIVKDVSGLIS